MKSLQHTGRVLHSTAAPTGSLAVPPPWDGSLQCTLLHREMLLEGKSALLPAMLLLFLPEEHNRDCLGRILVPTMADNTKS